MISSKNIKEYINFLHLKKYSAPATEDLKSRWSVLRDDEIAPQLQGLYLHWGIDSNTARNYEDTFIQFQQQGAAPPAYEQPVVQQQPSQYQQPVIAQPKSNKTPVYIAVIIALAGICGFMFYKMSQKPSAESPNADTSAVAAAGKKPDRGGIPQSAAAPVETTTAAPSAVTASGENDPQKVRVIENLMSAEESRDMSNILKCFSGDMQQYWDINYPTQAELVNRYNNTWTKTSDNTNSDVSIQRVSDNVYDMYSVYEYYSNKDGQTKAVNTHVRYVFDDNNKIIKTFGVK